MIRAVEGRGAQCIDAACVVLQALGIQASEGFLGPLHAFSSRRFKPDAASTADHDCGLPGSSGSRCVVEKMVAVLMIPSISSPKFGFAGQGGVETGEPPPSKLSCCIANS